MMNAETGAAEDRVTGDGDAELVAAVREGSVQALETLFRRHAPGLHRLAFRITGSRADADDVVQDVFVGLRRALARYEERGAFASWLRKVAARTALMRLRRKERVDVTPVESLAGVVGGKEDVEVEARLTARAALADLPESQRRVFLLKEVEGYSHREISELLEISPSASRVRLHRAWSALRERVGGAS